MARQRRMVAPQLRHVLRQAAVARRRALAGVRFCVPCQEAIDVDQRPGSGFNRRASKDSQLR